MFAFKELLSFYTKHGPAMYVAFLGASKAFYRVNRYKFLKKQEQCDIPKYILRVLSNVNEFHNQCQ